MWGEERAKWEANAKRKTKRELKIEQLEFPLPARLPRFNALDFMKFYRSLQTAGLSLSSVQDYIVAYLNMYFICISTSRTEVAGAIEAYFVE